MVGTKPSSLSYFWRTPSYQRNYKKRGKQLEKGGLTNERKMEPDASSSESARLSPGTPGALLRTYCSKSSSPLTWGEMIDKWGEITGGGNPHSPGSWLYRLRRHVELTSSKDWRTPYGLFKTYDFHYIALLREKGSIGDPFQFHSSGEKRAIARFLAREGVTRKNLEILFDRDILGNLSLDLNENPAKDFDLNEKPAKDFDLNEKPGLDLDLNKTPPAEEVEPNAGDDGGD
jgi:hypothetical protein